MRDYSQDYNATDGTKGSPRQKTYFSSLKNVIKNKPIIKKPVSNQFTLETEDRTPTMRHRNAQLFDQQNLTGRSVDHGYGHKTREIKPDYLQHTEREDSIQSKMNTARRTELNQMHDHGAMTDFLVSRQGTTEDSLDLGINSRQFKVKQSRKDIQNRSM